MNFLLQSLFLLVATAVATYGGGAYGNLESRARKPNFVLIMSDDQDVHLNLLDHMPLLQSHMTEQGTKFTKHYCTVAQCCPSRATLLTCKAAHNINVTNVKPPHGKLHSPLICLYFLTFSFDQGGWPKFVSRGPEKD